MGQSVANDPVLARFRAAVAGAYGARLDRVVLFGSRARGEARPDSDYDVAVFLKDMPDRFVELDRLADIAADILYDSGACIHALAYRDASYHDARQPLMYAIRAEGVDL